MDLGMAGRGKTEPGTCTARMNCVSLTVCSGVLGGRAAARGLGHTGGSNAERKSAKHERAEQSSSGIRKWQRTYVQVSGKKGEEATASRSHRKERGASQAASAAGAAADPSQLAVEERREEVGSRCGNQWLWCGRKAGTRSAMGCQPRGATQWHVAW